MADLRPSLIFDMDGTLWDSGEGVARSWTEMVQKVYDKNRVITTEEITSVMGKTMDVIADILFPELPERERYALLEKCGNYENDYLKVHGGILYPDLLKTLQTLRDRYRLFIVSNCQSGYIECFLDHYHFWHLFEDIECYGNNLKNKGDNIKLICERNGVSKVAYVGDIQGDYDSSCQAGVGFIHAAYGFGKVDADVPRIQTFAELVAVAEKYFA
ncbi:MAG: HAD family hydrolase [Lachnospiraceae bacterium]|nr:HAD family hydrolase [Lachnospiraceae bacterium]